MLSLLDQLLTHLQQQAADTLPFAFPPLLYLVFIFFARATDQTLSILRTLSVVRGQRLLAWGAGFLQSLLFVFAVTGLLVNLRNPAVLLVYAAGYASGQVFGLMVEGRLAPGHSLLRIISARRGAAILESLHQIGRGATELPAQGREGMVSVILCNIPRRRLDDVRSRILEIDPHAFLTIENVRELRGGWEA